jgi:nucleolar complex protein 2
MLYLTYVRNCKFVSPSTLPSVRFMRQSLAEMFALDDAASYQHVFLYVRQLAIHLRTAVTLHKKVPKHHNTYVIIRNLIFFEYPVFILI